MTSVCLGGIKHAGKSAVGRRLSQILGVRFVDLDVEIARTLGCPNARAVYRSLGANGFAQEEARATERVAANLQSDAAVVALGGGFIDNPQAIAALPAGVSRVALIVSLEVAWERVMTGGVPAFLAHHEDPHHAFVELMERRSRAYETWASTVVHIGDRSIRTVAADIATRLSASDGGAPPNRR